MRTAAVFLSFLTLAFPTSVSFGETPCPYTAQEFLCTVLSQNCEAVSKELTQHTPLLLMEKNPSTLALELEEKRALFRTLLRNRSAHLGEDRFVTVISPKGSHWMGQVVDYREKDGILIPDILYQGGNIFSYDPEVYPIYTSEESALDWRNSHDKFKKLLGEKKLNGYSSFILYQRPDTGTYLSARVIGYKSVQGRNIPKVIFKDGSQRILDEERMSTAILGGYSDFEKAYSDPVWRNSLDGIAVKKNIKALPKRLSALTDEGTPLEISTKAGFPVTVREYESDDPTRALTNIFPATQFGKGGNKISKLDNLGERLWQKKKVKLFYSAEFLNIKKVNGMFDPAAFIAAPEAQLTKPGKAIAMYTLASEDELADTGVHELGHLQTTTNIERNIRDPLAVSYEPVKNEAVMHPLPHPPGVENIYENYSQADEVRQQAFNFWNATHQRVSNEIVQNFRNRKLIKVHELFGINLNNFYDSMDEAVAKLESIRILNYRGEKLNTEALKNMDGFEKLKFYKGYKTVYIDHLGARVSIPLTPAVRKTLLRHSVFKDKAWTLYTLKYPKTRAIIFQYVKAMLESGNLMYRRQKEALDTADIIIADLKMNPERDLTQEEFRELQDRLGRVKTSVILKSDLK